MGKGANSNTLGPALTDFQCCWKECTAAKKHQLTYGKAQCHVCNRPRNQAMNPPKESIIKWKWDEMLAAESAKAQPAAKPKAKAKAKAKPGATQTRTLANAASANEAQQDDAAAAAAIRAERTEQMRAAKMGTVVTTASPGPTLAASQATACAAAARAVTEAYGGNFTGAREHATISAEITQRLLNLGPKLDGCITSLKSEQFPPVGNLKTAEEIVREHQHATHPTHSEVNSVEAQLAAARRSLSNYDDSGPAQPGDVLRSGLVDKVKSLETQAKKLKAQQPPAPVLLQGLVVVREKYLEEYRKTEEFIRAQTVKSEERLAKRLTDLEEAAAVIQHLKEEHDEITEKLEIARATRANDRESLHQKVLDLLREKEEEITNPTPDLEMEADVDFWDPDDDDAPLKDHSSRQRRNSVLRR